MLQQNCKAVYLLYRWWICCGPRQLIWYSEYLMFGLSGDRVPALVIFSSTSQNRPYFALGFLYKVSGSFPEKCGRGVMMTTHTLLPSRLKKSSYTSTTTMGLVACNSLSFNFIFTLSFNLFAVSQRVQLYTIMLQLQSVTLTMPSVSDIYRWVERLKETGGNYYGFVRKHQNCSVLKASVWEAWTVHYVIYCFTIFILMLSSHLCLRVKTFFFELTNCIKVLGWMGDCVYEWMNGWVLDGCLFGLLGDFVDGWLDVIVIKWMGVWMDVWLDWWVIVLMGDWTELWVDELVFRWMVGWIDGWLGWCVMYW
jgi:hypothetical protein